MSPNIGLHVRDVVTLFSCARWWELKNLRALLGSDADAGKALGYDFGPNPQKPEYAFLATDVRGAKRLFVYLDLPALITLDLVVSTPQAHWLLRGPEESKIRHTALLPKAEKKASDEALFLNVLEFGVARPLGEISSVEMAGVRIADRVVAFFTESTSARSSVSFSVRGEGTLKYLVAGLAPGVWEIWSNGWLEDPQGVVKYEAGALYFEGPPGDYFFRRL